ncbi:MAG TPA: transcriptional regulator [Firmicutes bacterium]|jgi:predicted NBD/HSP70 family sugar kinase|nr:transcriptional regulator [Bacillota bacterium]
MAIKDILTHINREGKQVFSLLQKSGPLTKNGLLEILKTNFTALNRIMDPLEKEKFIMEVGIGESSGGRKPLLYDLDPKCFYVLGIDISRVYTKIVIADSKMNIISKKTFEMDATFTPEKTVREIALLFQKAVDKLGLHQEQFLGVGLGTVGPLDRSSGIMLRPKYFPSEGWTGSPIKERLEQALGLPVMIDNGANTAILAEYKFGAGKGFQNIAYFNCSTGIRTGAISAGVIVRTINDAEDAFGHMVINCDGEACNCGNYGCIDCYASIYAIVRKYQAALKQGRSTGIDKDIDEIDYTDICGAAEGPEPLAQEIITNAATIFGVGLANYINLLNPGLIILSGPLISYSNLYYQIASEIASTRHYDKEANHIIFSKGGFFGEDAIALGAAIMVVESYLLL